jgi:hypothetical protein
VLWGQACRLDARGALVPAFARGQLVEHRTGVLLLLHVASSLPPLVCVSCSGVTAAAEGDLAVV